MEKKIVAIGGGRMGRRYPDGTHLYHETAPIDEEIINLTGKKCPNYLYINHAVPLLRQGPNFHTAKNVYGRKYTCVCKSLKSSNLTDKSMVKEYLDWADIIYEGGGNTFEMLKLWEETGFKEELKKAWESGKVMCGLSAGANCWFEYCHSDSLKIEGGEDKPYIRLKCLGFVKGIFVPHANEAGRRESVKEMLKEKNNFALSLSNCAALEIVGEKYRILTGDASNYGFTPYGVKSYWQGESYKEERIVISEKFRPIEELMI